MKRRAEGVRLKLGAAQFRPSNVQDDQHDNTDADYEHRKRYGIIV
jgi:hypothetical protein